MVATTPLLPGIRVTEANSTGLSPERRFPFMLALCALNAQNSRAKRESIDRLKEIKKDCLKYFYIDKIIFLDSSKFKFSRKKFIFTSKGFIWPL